MAGTARQTFVSAALLFMAAAEPGRAEQQRETATFAAGCYWSIELVFQRTPGVLSTLFTVYDNGYPHSALMFGGVGLNFSGVERTAETQPL